MKPILTLDEVRNAVIGQNFMFQTPYGMRMLTYCDYTASGRSLKFIEQLRKYISLPLIVWDERFTTKIAKNILINANMSRKKRKNVIDKMSAVIILQEYLDRQKR